MIQLRDSGGLNQGGSSGEVTRNGQILDVFGR